MKGYLYIQLIGYSPERFLNLCKNKNINIWGLKSCHNHYEMNILMKDFKNLRPLCKKTITKVRIKERIGLPFLLYQLKNRKSFICGCVCAIVILFLSSLHIWSIQIIGNQKLSCDVISTYLENQDITKGIPIKKVDCKEIASNMRENFEDIVWVSVSIDGTSLSIELKENQDSMIQMEEDKIPSDIVAKEDAIIKSIIVRSGIPMVQPGTSVKKGDLLVSGSIPILNDSKEVVSTHYVKADADIIGETQFIYQDKIDGFYQSKQYIKDGINKEIFQDYTWIKYRTIKKYILIDSNYTEDEKSTILQNNHIKFCDSLVQDNIKILEENLIITHYDNYSTSRSHLRLEQPIDLLSKNMIQ